jgi:hypothetical protein
MLVLMPLRNAESYRKEISLGLATGANSKRGLLLMAFNAVYLDLTP